MDLSASLNARLAFRPRIFGVTWKVICGDVLDTLWFESSWSEKVILYESIRSEECMRQCGESIGTRVKIMSIIYFIFENNDVIASRNRSLRQRIASQERRRTAMQCEDATQ